jgi:hypothetical protein
MTRCGNIMLNLWFAGFPTKTEPDGSVIEFTFFWKKAALGRPELCCDGRLTMTSDLRFGCSIPWGEHPISPRQEAGYLFTVMSK